MRIVLISCAFGLILMSSFDGKDKLTPYPFPDLKYFPAMPVNVNNRVTVEGALLGRYLFYDPVLSADSSMSCASCHKQQYAFSDAPNALSVGLDQSLMLRNTLPLFNLAWYPAYFWDGRAVSIEDQVFHPVRNYNEMNLDWSVAEKRLKKSKFYADQFKLVFGSSDIDSVDVSNAIAQFLRTLISYQSEYDRVIAGNGYLDADEYQGFVLMNDQVKGDCIHCHTTDGDALGTTLTFSNNGLDAVDSPNAYLDWGRGAVTGNQMDNGKFKVPSLRNLAYTAPYMHDGRFKTLKEVLDFYSSGVHPSVNVDTKMEYAYQGGVHLTEIEKHQIIAFLLTLSDNSFISNPEFSNPFTE